MQYYKISEIELKMFHMASVLSTGENKGLDFSQSVSVMVLLSDSIAKLKSIYEYST